MRSHSHSHSHYQPRPRSSPLPTASVPGVVPPCVLPDRNAQPSIGRYSQQQQPQRQPQPLVRPLWVCVCVRVGVHVCVCMCLTLCNWTAQFSFAFVSCCIFYTRPRPSAAAHVGCACEAKFVSSSCLLLYSIFQHCFVFCCHFFSSLACPTCVTHFVGCFVVGAVSFRLPSASNTKRPLPRPPARVPTRV